MPRVATCRGENGLSVTVSAQRATDSDPANSSEQGTAGDSMNFEPGNSGELNGGKRFTSTDVPKCREVILALLGETVAERPAAAREGPETSASSLGNTERLPTGVIR
jgi:hypothetical protein